MTATITAPKCWLCRTRECSADYEPESGLSFFSTCEACFWIVSAAPYCYNPECSGRPCGTRTEIANPGPEITKETARYACPNGCGTATAIGWAIGSGRHSAVADVERRAEGGLDLVEVRLSQRGIASGLNAEHPARRAYAEAYVETAVALLSGKEVRA